MDDNNSADGNDKSDTELVKECELKLNQILETRIGKRKEREEDTNSEESFIEVRRNRKRYLRNRSCPMYRKEKEIRNVMSRENITYRNALQIVVGTSQRENPMKITQPLEVPMQTSNSTIRPTYSQVLTNAEIHREASPERNIKDTELVAQKKKSKKSRKEKIKKIEVQNSNENINKCGETDDELKSLTDSEDIKHRRFELKKLLAKIYAIWMSKKSTEEKISDVFVVIFDEIKVFINGSKSREHQGAAFFDPSLKKTGSFIVKNKVCIMTLELIAISKALAYAETDNWDKIVICSDSKSAIQHLARCASGYKGVPTAFVYSATTAVEDTKRRSETAMGSCSHWSIWKRGG
ncbi:hypothetical protein EVAR_49394_1 [Eumeta japonica]|uniref:Uncharacterized protein n=1 Tax=Eumeta variegata TaxID=151549 RepID=A0A4C1YS71_EUMVA|nr:hypothetical protein EVAR_49394_1 [Eumeta japonica]